MPQAKPVPDGMHTVTPHLICAGAKITMPVADMFWGDRCGQLEDPFGHRWPVATHTRDVGPEEMKQVMQKMGGRAPADSIPRRSKK